MLYSALSDIRWQPEEERVLVLQAYCACFRQQPRQGSCFILFWWVLRIPVSGFYKQNVGFRWTPVPDVVFLIPCAMTQGLAVLRLLLHDEQNRLQLTPSPWSWTCVPGKGLHSLPENLGMFSCLTWDLTWAAKGRTSVFSAPHGHSCSGHMDNAHLPPEPLLNNWNLPSSRWLTETSQINPSGCHIQTHSARSKNCQTNDM